MDTILGGMEWDGAKYHPSTQNGPKFKMCVFFLIFSA